MHSFLRAIGFSKIKNGSDVELLLREVFHEYDRKEMVKQDIDVSFVEYSKEFGPDMGIKLCGILDENGFHQEYYFPYFRGTGITSNEDVIVDKRGESDSYVGVCEDIRVGVSLIFYLQNSVEYLKENFKSRNASTTLSGLSISGRVILPIHKEEKRQAYDMETVRKRNHLIAEARKGNEEAIESLTLEDIDTYSMITKRIANEDVLTIVESFFMPFGMECDQYQVMGEIKSVTDIANYQTKERMYQLEIACNDLTFDICIHQEDLMGEPKPGRRFKGAIWLQGHLDYGKDRF